MKKYLYLFAALLVALMGVSLTACGDDNDEPISTTQECGSITVKYKGYDAEKYYVYSASLHYDARREETHFEAKLIEKHGDLIPSNSFGFDVNGNGGLASGTILKLKDIYLTSGLAWNTYDQTGGQVKVKSLTGDRVTLELNDLKYGNAVLNGEITYKIEVY